LPPSLTLEETRDKTVLSATITTVRPANETAGKAVLSAVVADEVRLHPMLVRIKTAKNGLTLTTVYNRFTSPWAFTGKVVWSMRTVPVERSEGSMRKEKKD
jgi:hypothetical protein